MSIPGVISRKFHPPTNFCKLGGGSEKFQKYLFELCSNKVKIPVYFEKKKKLPRGSLDNPRISDTPKFSPTYPFLDIQGNGRKSFWHISLFFF